MKCIAQLLFDKTSHISWEIATWELFHFKEGFINSITLFPIVLFFVDNTNFICAPNNLYYMLSCIKSIDQLKHSPKQHPPPKTCGWLHIPHNYGTRNLNPTLHSCTKIGGNLKVNSHAKFTSYGLFHVYGHSKNVNLKKSTDGPFSKTWFFLEKWVIYC